MSQSLPEPPTSIELTVEDLEVLSELDTDAQLKYVLEMSKTQRAAVARRRKMFKSKNPAASKALSRAAKKASSKAARIKGLKKFFANKSRVAKAMKYRGKTKP